MNVLVNYANELFRQQQVRNSQSALTIGGFDRVCSFGPSDIDPEFAERNRHILEQPRGNGYWLWKPYFISRVLRTLDQGDCLFYCDAGAHFIAAFDPLIDVMRRDEQGLIVFELPYPECHWTKRDAFVLLDCDRPEYIESRQRLASFHLWRRTDLSLRLVQEWLELAQDERLSTDLSNQCGLANHPGFREHRHDQSLLSLLTKKYGLAAHRNPSGTNRREQYPNSPYGQLINHTRLGRPSLPWRLWKRTRRLVVNLAARWQMKAA
jgi:hypothetical protein